VVVPATSNTRFPTRAPVTTSPTRSPASTNRPVLQPSPTSDPKPRLLNMTLLNHPSLTKDGVVDVANGPVTLTVEMTVVARLQKECVFFPFNSYCNDGTSFTLEATCRGELGKGDTRITAALQPEQDMPNYTPVTLKYDLVFPKNNIALGPCNFTLVVLDRKQNYYLGLDTAAMAAQGYPSRLTVINSQGTSLQNMFVGFEITYESLFYHQIYVSCRRSADFAASQLLEYGFNGVMRADNADRWGGKPTPWFSVDDNEINTYNFNYNNFDGDSLYNVTLGVELLHSNANIRSRLGPQDLAVLGFPNTTVVVRRQF
jgi:hypothetical protein